MTKATTAALAAQPTAAVDLLDEFAKNPRRHWGNLEELAASIKANGIIEPLVIRPKAKDRFEVIAGSRRLRAAKIAGLRAVPVVLREADDQAALEVALVENLQRHDVHPLNEAAGYAALQRADKAYTPEAIAAKFGKSTSYVYRRLRLTNLIGEAARKFETDQITAAHAERLARLDPAQQAEALRECFLPLFGAGHEKGETEPAPISRLDDWIEKHTRTAPASEDAKHYFPEIADDVAAEGAALLQLSESHTPNADLGEKQKGLIGRASWTPILAAKDRCKSVRQGVVVHGGPMRVIDVCAEKGCPKHRPAAPPQRKATQARADAKREQAYARERAKAEKERRDGETFRRAGYAAAAAAAKATKTIAPLILARAVYDYHFGDIDHAAFAEEFGIEIGRKGWRDDADDKTLAALVKLGPQRLAQALTFCALQESANAFRGEKQLPKAIAWFKRHKVDFRPHLKAAREAQAAAQATEEPGQ